MLLDALNAEPYESWSQFVNNLGSVAVIVAGTIWFFATRKFRRRIQFDLDCKIYYVRDEPSKRVAEIQLIIENKGLVNHRLRELTVAVHGLPANSDLEVRDDTGELRFPLVLLEKTNIVPTDYGYYFVRPGVRQVITHIIPVTEASLSLIRVTAGFDYDWKGRFPHTVRRAFTLNEKVC